MHRLIVLLGLVAALVVVAPAGTADRPIVISAAGFAPRNVTINVGDTVTWSNTDTRAHQVVVDRVCSITVQPASYWHLHVPCDGSVRLPRAHANPERVARHDHGTGSRGSAVTIAASPRLVTYLGATTLSGAVSTAQPNERVSVRAQAVRQHVVRVSRHRDHDDRGCLDARRASAEDYGVRGTVAWRHRPDTTVTVRPRVTRQEADPRAVRRARLGCSGVRREDRGAPAPHRRPGHGSGSGTSRSA